MSYFNRYGLSVYRAVTLRCRLCLRGHWSQIALQTDGAIDKKVDFEIYIADRKATTCI